MTRQKYSRGYRKNLQAGPLGPLVDSFELHLHAEHKAENTIRTYREAALWIAGEHLVRDLDPDTGLGAARRSWGEVTRPDIERWLVWLIETYSATYANNQCRALQQYFKWWAADPDEPHPNPMVGMTPPAIGERLVPVFTDAELEALIASCKGPGLVARRDLAIISLFRDTGLRLAELASITLDTLNLRTREVTVIGKGDKERTVKFSFASAKAIDRYLRARSGHEMSRRPELWLGKGSKPPLTASGIYQMIARRGTACGVAVNPHKFRHHFSHTWLDRGGAEGDLMELNGWSSPQMLRRYGRSAAASRARRAYDQIMDDPGRT